jgi:hypothetical protein
MQKFHKNKYLHLVNNKYNQIKINNRKKYILKINLKRNDKLYGIMDLKFFIIISHNQKLNNFI